MTPPPAVRHVVARCPRCGVEHDVSAGAVCEACHTPLRPWCRAHGRETGWLDGPACPRCAEEAARPPSRPRPLAIPCPAPALPAHVDSASSPTATAPAPAAPPPRGRVAHGMVMILMMLTAAGGGAMLGVIAGFVYVLSGRGALPDSAVRFAVAGAVLGVLFGGFSCVHYVHKLRKSPPRTMTAAHDRHPLAGSIAARRDREGA